MISRHWMDCQLLNTGVWFTGITSNMYYEATINKSKWFILTVSISSGGESSSPTTTRYSVYHVYKEEIYNGIKWTKYRGTLRSQDDVCRLLLRLNKYEDNKIIRKLYR